MTPAGLDVIHVLLPLLGLCATMVGIVSQPWDEAKVGLAKITRVGWAVVVVALLSAAGSIVLASEQAARKHHLRALAVQDLALAIKHFHAGLRPLDGTKEGDLAASMMLSSASFQVDSVEEPLRRLPQIVANVKFWTAVSSLDLRSQPPLVLGRHFESYCDLIDKELRPAVEALRSIARGYAEVLTVEELRALLAISDSYQVRMLLGLTDAVGKNALFDGQVKVFDSEILTRLWAEEFARDIGTVIAIVQAEGE